MKDIFQSIALLTLISSAGSLFFSELGIVFWRSFLFITILQILGWNIFRYFQQAKIIAKNQEIDRIAMENIGKQQVKLPCSACNIEHLVLVELNTANTFVCEACDQKNSVYINIETAAMTVIDE